ncbi:hypothetical protein CRUP_028182 [Coryphaenoides rupestris]|nr:hypothetical protein CRUP_028182 [Coryphaenoides rupestris]
MKKYASATQAQFDLTLKLKPLSVKVVEATLKLTLSCVFLKEGKATDEDMQSLASLMSLKQSDIGNLDDFNDSDEEAGEDRRASFGLATPVTEFKRHLSTLAEEDYASSVPTGDNSASNQNLEPPRTQERKPGAPFGAESVRISAGNPQIKKPKAEEVDTLKMHLDAPEPDVVLGWEVLEADGTVTDKEIESSLLVKGKENSGLVNTIVGVFNRGYETVASILAPSNSGVAEADQPKDVEMLTEAVAEKCSDSTATAPQEDWLHLEKINESEHKEINLGQEVGVEEVDFCLVSVAVGDVEEEWARQERNPQTNPFQFLVERNA